jgi:DNA replication protein DnaC
MRDRLQTKGNNWKNLSETVNFRKLEPAEVPCMKCGNKFLSARWQIGNVIKRISLCPECNSKLVEETKNQEQSEREEYLVASREKFRRICGILPRFSSSNFSNFKLDSDNHGIANAYRKTKEYADTFPVASGGRGFNSIILFSENSWGVGKTHLAVSIAQTIIDRWNGTPMSCPIQFVTEPQLLLNITSTYNYSPEEKTYRDTEEKIIQKAIRVPLLIIDDLGKRTPSNPEFVRRIMFSIIDGRYSNNLPLVLTTNMSPEALRLYLGGGKDESCIDRLIEMCRGSFLRLDGKSRRRI